MKQNSRFYLALHSLGHLAQEEGVMQTSAQIAEHAGTNPVVVRRVLGRLREAGLLLSEKGHAGGWTLARPAEEITLADVYRALDESIISSLPTDFNPSCSVEDALTRRVSSIILEAERNLLRGLGEATIANLGEA